MYEWSVYTSNLVYIATVMMPVSEFQYVDLDCLCTHTPTERYQQSQLGQMS